MIHIGLQQLVTMLIQLIIGGLIFWLIWWALHKIAPPEPIMKVGEVLLILFVVLWLISLLLGLSGHPVFVWTS